MRKRKLVIKMFDMDSNMLDEAELDFGIQYIDDNDELLGFLGESGVDKAVFGMVMYKLQRFIQNPEFTEDEQKDLMSMTSHNTGNC